MLITLLLTACTSTSSMGADAIGQLDDLRSLVSAHKEAVDSAATMDEVTTEESTHAAAMATVTDDMDTMMGSMMACAMDDTMSTSMSDADTHMTDMMDAVAAHTADHVDHVDMAACIDEEASYSTMMGEHLDAMSTDMSGFDESADCTGSSTGMM